MAEDKKNDEEECDPLTEDCDRIRGNVLERTEESAILERGIRDIETGLKAIDAAAKIFEDDDGGDAFKEEREKLLEKLENAKKMKEECDDECFDGVKKFNICKKPEP